MRKKLIAVMTAGTMMAMAGAPVQAAEGEKDIVVAQADEMLARIQWTEQMNCLMRCRKRCWKVFVIMGGNSMLQTKTWQIHFMLASTIRSKALQILITMRFL